MKYVIAFVHYLLLQVATVPIISVRYKLVSLCGINRVSDTRDACIGLKSEMALPARGGVGVICLRRSITATDVLDLIELPFLQTRLQGADRLLGAV